MRRYRKLDGAAAFLQVRGAPRGDARPRRRPARPGPRGRRGHYHHRRPGLPATPSEAAARGYRAAADAPATLRAYRADLACYQAWCAREV
jgi:hypothetical protein